MVVVLLANGFEELEALTPVDVLRRNNIDVRTVSITNEKLITGTHGIQVATDLIASDVPLSDIDMLILPGGMPGVKNLDASPITKIFIDATLKNGGRLAAICAAPSIFGRHGMLTNIKATCFPGFEGEMLNAIVKDTDVITDGIFTTARDYRAAMAFADELVLVCDKLGIKPHDENEISPITKDDEDDLLKFETEEIFSFEDFFALSDDDEPDAEVSEPTESVTTDLNIISNEPLSDEDVLDIKFTKELIVSTLKSFSVTAQITDVEFGPRMTRYYIVPERGVKVSSVTRLFDDLSLVIARAGVRMEAPIPGKSAIGLEVPNKNPKTVNLSELTLSEEFRSATSKTCVAIGKDIVGNPIFGDVAKFPHALITGATGMGKSVCINTVLASLITKSSPDDLRLILIDPKMVEFRAYSTLPHLLTPIITDAKSAAAALNWAIDEMERRYSLIEHFDVRNIDAYNDKVKADPSLGIPEPKIVIVIDELADLMIQLRDPIEALIMRIAQKARAAGIHLIVATQRPSVSVITGAIKANIPTRICFKVTSQVDSRVVLDMKGAENLLNRGDMLYWPVSSSAPMRAQCAYISDSEIAQIVATASEKYPDSAFKTAVADYISNNKSKYTCSSFYETEDDDCDGSESFLGDQCFLDSVEIAIASRKVSTSLLQRKLSIGYGKAAKYIDAMEELGIISEPRGQKPREVLMTSEEWTKKLSLLE